MKWTRTSSLHWTRSSTSTRSCLVPSSRTSTTDIALQSLNFNKKLPGPIFKDEHNGHRITEFVGLRPKMYCLVDEKQVIHNAAKGVPRNVVIDGKRMSVKNIDLYKRVLEAEKKGNAVIEGSFKRINNQAFDISTKEQTKTLMICTDNKRWILDDNVHTLAFGHYRMSRV